MPSLPERYASPLTLTYDWHLPGKEKRRKRKHRKSHGAISFQDLSNRISAAWKIVDPEIKNFCAQICKIGLQKFKVEMKEWKKRQGQKSRETVVISTKLNALNAIDKPTVGISRMRTISYEELPKDDESSTALAASPSPVASEEVSIPTKWEGLDQQITSPVPSDDLLNDFQVADFLGTWAQEELSSVTKPDECTASSKANFVDIEDEDIMNMWRASTMPADVDEQPVLETDKTFCQSCNPVSVATPSSIPTSFNNKMQDAKVGVQYQHTLFGNSMCYNQTLEEIQRMKLELEQQRFAIMQSHTFMARSA